MWAWMIVKRPTTEAFLSVHYAPNDARDGGDFIRDDTRHAPIAKATKCDLCVDQWGGPACQRACPHDALVRMDMSQVSALTEWLKR